MNRPDALCGTAADLAPVTPHRFAGSSVLLGATPQYGSIAEAAARSGTPQLRKSVLLRPTLLDSYATVTRPVA